MLSCPEISSRTSCVWRSRIPLLLVNSRALSGIVITMLSITAALNGCSRRITSPPTCCSAIAYGPSKPQLPHGRLSHNSARPFEPTAYAQRLEHALGLEPLLIRFRTYREYPAEEQARWRIIELLE